MNKSVAALGFVLAAGLLAAGVSSGGRPQAEKAGPGSGLVPVAVRVFDGKKLVTDLSAGDFEILEDGIPRPVEALYFVDKNAAEKRSGEAGQGPDVHRRFYLLFQLFEYHPKLAEAIRYFFDRELLAGDSLEIQTPMKTYRLSPAAFASRSKAELAEEMTNIVKKDIVQGSLAYNSLLTELKRHARAIGGTNTMGGLDTDTETEEIGIELLLPRYKEILSKMDALRRIDFDKFTTFAQALKAQSGQKFVFLVYQREFRPEISPAVIHSLMATYQDAPHILGGIQEAFMAYTRNISQNVGLLCRSFADSSARFDLIFMNKAPEQMARIVMREQSEDIFKAFSAVAAATGGTTYTAQNPAAGIESAMETSNRYYLLYFAPFYQTGNGTFRNLKVRIKERDYAVVARSGYIY